MIKQYLLNTNESATVYVLQIFLSKQGLTASCSTGRRLSSLLPF
jgi:hypothetical protein